MSPDTLAPRGLLTTNPLWKGVPEGIRIRWDHHRMRAGYDTNGRRSDDYNVTIGRELVGPVGAGEAAERALRLLAVGVGDHTPIEVQEQVAEIARRLAQLEPPAHRRG